MEALHCLRSSSFFLVNRSFWNLKQEKSQAKPEPEQQASYFLHSVKVESMNYERTTARKPEQ